MGSGLRAKLKALNETQAAPRPPKRTGGFQYYRVRRDLEPGLMDLSGTALRRIGWTGGRFDVRKCLFLDTETTGLSGGAGTVAFLVGVGFVSDGAFVIEQYLMKDYSDEPEMLDRLASRMDEFDSVCTFNGKTFDVPLLESRFTMCRMRHRWREMENLDLLHPARRTWKLRLGSCRLARLEEEILGIPRENDLPGSEVPQRYFQFLKTGDMALLEDIIEHNRQDIATLPKLLTRLCSVYQDPGLITDRKDQYSVGRALERQGELKAAREIYRVSAMPAPAGTISALTGERIAAMSGWRLYLIERKNGNVEGMRAALEQMLARGRMPVQAHIEMAKLEEHRTGNLEAALDHARKARKICAREEAEALDKRIARLERKIAAQE